MGNVEIFIADQKKQVAKLVSVKDLRCALLTLTLCSVFLKENGRFVFFPDEKQCLLVLSSLVLEPGKLWRNLEAMLRS